MSRGSSVEVTVVGFACKGENDGRLATENAAGFDGVKPYNKGSHVPWELGAMLMTRYAAVNVVAAGLAEQCQVTLTYENGYDEHPRVAVKAEGLATGLSLNDLARYIRDHFELAANRTKLVLQLHLVDWELLDLNELFELTPQNAVQFGASWERSDKGPYIRRHWPEGVTKPVLNEDEATPARRPSGEEGVQPCV